MKVIRCYATQENALNASAIIQDLLISKLERMLDYPLNQKELSDKKEQLGSECA
ncbi:hypothetical protein ACSBO6_18750 [Bacillus sp. AL-1R]